MDEWNSPFFGEEIDLALANGLMALRVDGQTALSEAQKRALLRQLLAVGVTAQDWTAEQKAQARRNIGAGDGAFRVLGQFVGLDELQRSVPNPQLGDAYAIGESAPYDIYIWTGEWFNAGPIAAAPVTSVNGKTGAVQLSAYDIWYNELTGISVGSWIESREETAQVNPNLLDNWFFRRPVNQRGGSSYELTAAGLYTIDRWKASGATGRLTVSEGVGVEIENTSGTAELVLGQKFEFPVRSSVMSVSVLTTWINGSATVRLIHSDATVHETMIEEGLISAVDSSYKDITELQILVGPGASLMVEAVKLETGSSGTLAYQSLIHGIMISEIPDYGTQLARCQRFFLRIKGTGTGKYGVVGPAFANATTQAQANVPLPVSMRVLPIVNYGGQWAFFQFAGTQTICPANSMSPAALLPNAVQIGVMITGATTGTMGMLRANNDAAAYIDLSADL